MIYLHVPFCESFCVYCDFYSERRGSRETYAEAVLKEIDRRETEIGDNILAADAVDTLYVGGGTPSVLPPSVFSPVVRRLKRIRDAALGPGSWREFTVEVNPEDIVEKGEEYVLALLSLGVNRVSMGIQSLDDGILCWMNRRHDSARALEAYGVLRSADALWRGENPAAKPLAISVDLIFGISQLSMSQWEDSLVRVLDLRPEHISAYQLSVEDGSALAKSVASGKYVEASEELCRGQYDRLSETLAEAGYVHYEISNFALPGHEAVHNSAYWDRKPYVGLGPGAHSFSRLPSGEERRSWNAQVLPRRAADGSLSTYSSEYEILTPEDARVEELMLSLRTAKGMELSRLYSLAGKTVTDTFLSEGALVLSGGRVRIPERCFFVSDEIIRDLA